MTSILAIAAEIAELLGITPDNMTPEDAELCIALAIQYQHKLS